MPWLWLVISRRCPSSRSSSSSSRSREVVQVQVAVLVLAVVVVEVVAAVVVVLVVLAEAEAEQHHHYCGYSERLLQWRAFLLNPSLPADTSLVLLTHLTSSDPGALGHPPAWRQEFCRRRCRRSRLELALKVI